MIKSNTINISCVCSDEYSPYFGTMLVSLLSNLNKNSKLNIYLLSEDLSKDAKLKIEKLKRIHPFNVEYIYLKDEDFNFLTNDIQCPEHVKRIAAARILLPILLNDIDKVLSL